MAAKTYHRPKNYAFTFLMGLLLTIMIALIARWTQLNIALGLAALLGFTFPTLWHYRQYRRARKNSHNT